MATRLAPLVLAIGVLAIGRSAVSASAGEQPEPDLKAELIERFTRFVDWESLPETMMICVVGDTPIKAQLQKIARRQTIKGRRARVLTVVAEDVADCQVVLIAGEDPDQLHAVLARTNGRPILSISESPGAAAAGTIINLYLEDQHVRFEINTSAAKHARLTLRSKLLKLARIVGGETSAP
ncbi:MAG: YfiR family protein [Kofleriaceae bacterium]|nr:YfiR family protein [Kofleriaceae bacterium]